MRWILVFALLACGPLRPSPAVAPTGGEVITEALPPPKRFAPASEPAAEYGGEALAAPSRLDDAVLAALRTFVGATRDLVLDERMARAAGDLAAVAPRDGDLSAELVELAVERQGVAEALPRLTVLWAAPDQLDAVGELVKTRVPPEVVHAPRVRVGVGVGPLRDGVAPIAVVAVASRIALQPFSRTARASEAFTIHAAIDDKLRDPVVVVQRPDGAVDRPAVAADGPAGFTTSIECSVPGRLQVDITATHPQGPIAIASMPVWCGVEPPAQYLWESSTIESGIADGATAARRLVALVNRDRRAAGLPLLASDAEATAAARAHAAAQRSAAAGTIASVPPPDVKGVAYSATHTRGLRAAYESLANAAGPRDSMLSLTSTHVGAGVELAGGELFATLVYRKITPQLDTTAVARDIEARIEAATRKKPYRDLKPIAVKLVRELIVGVPQREAWQDMRWWLDDLRYRFSRFNYVITIVSDLRLVQPAHLLGPRITGGGEYAIVVGQRDHPLYGKNAIWIVVLTAEYRDR